MQRFEKGEIVLIVEESDSGASVDVYSTVEMSLMDRYELPEYQEFGSYDELVSYSKDNAIFSGDSSYTQNVFSDFDEESQEDYERFSDNWLNEDENDEYSLSEVAEYYNDYIDDFDEYEDF